ncbi:MAG: thiamine phosphate synthase [Acidobacteriota bacterium]
MAIVDADVAAQADWSPLDLAAAFLDGGARLLQVRAKHASSAALLDLATAVVALSRRCQAVVVVNDRADVARLAAADGVHVGQDDLDASSVRTLLGPDAVVGLSTHTPAQLDDALQQPVTYVAVGPVFGTSTKATGYEAIGLDAVREAARQSRARRRPLVAIGGITIDSAPDVLAAGADCVAVIGDLLRTGDPTGRVRAYLDRLTL